MKLAKRKYIHSALQIANPNSILRNECKNYFLPSSEKLAFKLLNEKAGNKNSSESIGFIHTHIQRKL